MLFAVITATIALFPVKAFAASDLVVTMQGPAQAERGREAQYTVTVANNGPDQALQVRLSGSVPYDFLFEPASSDSRCSAPYGALACDLGLLSSGTITNLTLTFTVRPLTSLSYCSPLAADISASLSFGGTDHLWGNNSASVRTTVPCPPPVECNDGIDNDRDGAVDYSAYSWGNGDFGCTSPTDRDERYPEAACQDGRDNDADGLSDFPWDPGCSSRQDNDEFHPLPPPPPQSPPPPSVSLPQTLPPQSPPHLSASLVPQGTMPWLALPIPRCYNNVGAGWVEDIMIDIRCDGSKWGQRTSGGGSGNGGRIPACRDGKDNDGDGSIDFPADPGCWGKSDASEEGTGGRGGGNGGGGNGGGGSGSGGGGEKPPEEGATCTGRGQAIIERVAHQQELFPGAVVRYTITVRNASARCPLMNLVLRNRLPPGTIVLDAGGGLFDGHELRWHIPRIDPGATRRISYSLRVPRSFSGDRFGGELSLDGADGRISDGGLMRVLRSFPKTGVDAAAMKTIFWVVLAGGSLGLGGVLGRRLSSSHW